MTGNDYPLVSVIVPYYNGRKYIRQAIQSILDQTYRRIEIIVVDDASPDTEDANYIKELSQELGYELIIHSINKGIGPTMADAAEAARGDYIAELSQDDFYKPKKIEKQMAEVIDKKLNAVYAASDILEQASGRIQMRETTKTRDIIQSGKAADYLKTQNLKGISIQGLLAERCVYENDIIPIWRDYLLDDWPVNARLFEKYKVSFLEEPLWTGRGHEANTSRNIWKWFGPQIEVVARLAPDSLKAEAVGNRIASTVRRLFKQDGRTEDTIRLAAGALMLTDIPQHHKKASGVLHKISSRDRKAVLNHKCKRLEDIDASTFERPSLTTNTCRVDWNKLGKKIADVVKSQPEEKRVSQIGRIFVLLANTLLQESRETDFDAAAKIALCGFIMVDGTENEDNVLKMLTSIQSEQVQRMIKNKIRVLKSKRGFSIKTLLKTQ